LDKDVQGCDPGVDKIAEDEIDNAVLASERHGGLATDFGQRQETLSLPSSHDDS
jgi:hypothetical protein